MYTGQQLDMNRLPEAELDGGKLKAEKQGSDGMAWKTLAVKLKKNGMCENGKSEDRRGE